MMWYFYFLNYAVSRQKTLVLYSKRCVQSDSEVRFRLTQPKMKKIDIFFHSLSFLTLKYKFFLGTSGYRKWSKPLPSHNFNLSLCPQEKFGRISRLGWPWWSAPISIIEKNSSMNLILWVSLNRDNKHPRYKFSYVVLAKWIFSNFRGPFCDDINNRDHSYFWLNREINQCLRPEVDSGDILELFGCNMFSKKLLKLKGIHGSLPIA